jgi:mannan endo-1,4-beta-mannosidase
MKLSSLLSIAPSFAVATSAFTSYAKTSGSVFTINGKTEYWMGTNAYWLSFLTDNANVDLVMSHLAPVRPAGHTGMNALNYIGHSSYSISPLIPNPC